MHIFTEEFKNYLKEAVENIDASAFETLEAQLGLLKLFINLSPEGERFLKKYIGILSEDPEGYKALLTDIIDNL